MVGIGFFQLPVNEVHAGPGEPTGIAFHIEDHPGEANGFAFIKKIGRQY